MQSWYTLVLLVWAMLQVRPAEASFNQPDDMFLFVPMDLQKIILVEEIGWQAPLQMSCVSKGLRQKMAPFIDELDRLLQPFQDLFQKLPPMGRTMKVRVLASRKAFKLFDGALAIPGWTRLAALGHDLSMKSLYDVLWNTYPAQDEGMKLEHQQVVKSLFETSEAQTALNKARLFNLYIRALGPEVGRKVLDSYLHSKAGGLPSHRELALFCHLSLVNRLVMLGKEWDFFPQNDDYVNCLKTYALPSKLEWGPLQLKAFRLIKTDSQLTETELRVLQKATDRDVRFAAWKEAWERHMKGSRQFEAFDCLDQIAADATLSPKQRNWAVRQQVHNLTHIDVKDKPEIPRVQKLCELYQESDDLYLQLDGYAEAIWAAYRTGDHTQLLSILDATPKKPYIEGVSFWFHVLARFFIHLQLEKSPKLGPYLKYALREDKLSDLDLVGHYYDPQAKEALFQQLQQRLSQMKPQIFLSRNPNTPWHQQRLEAELVGVDCQGTELAAPYIAFIERMSSLGMRFD